MRVLRYALVGATAMVFLSAACEDDAPTSPAVASVASTGGGAGGPASTAASGAQGGGGAGGGAGGVGPEGDWSCLGMAEAPTFTSGPPTEIQLFTNDSLNINPIAGVDVRVCDYTDPACASPTSLATSDSTGLATIFEAIDHRQFHDHALDAAVVPTLRFFNGPVLPSACGMPDPAACECEGCTLPQCDDGMGNFADCPCPQCATDPYCGNPNNCTDDGLCHPYFEGCVCADCAGHPLCAGQGGSGGTGQGGAGGSGGSGGMGGFACVDVTVQRPFLDSVPLMSPQELAEVMQAANTSADPTRGHIVLQVRDCGGEGAPGVALTVDTADGQSTYGYVGSSGTAEPGLDQTSEIARVFVFNVPPGEAIVAGEIVASGEMLPVRRVQVRAGALSHAADMDPTPEAQ